MIILRNYQEEAIQAIFDSWAAGVPGNYLVSMATGTGKSIVISDLARRLHQQYKARVLMLVDVAELITQNLEKLLLVYPDAPVGVFSASLNRREIHEPIVYASIQSIAKHIHKRDAFDVVLIDEVHCVSNDENSRYRKTLDTLKMMNPYMRVIGFTATPYRMTTGMLCEGEDKLFDCIVYEANVLDMINQGWLSRLTTRGGGSVHIDTSQVHLRGGEFISGELEAAAMAGDVTERAASDIVNRGRDRKSWIVFATGVDHAKQIVDCIKKQGIPVAMVTGDTPKEERKQIIADHKSCAIRCLVNVQVLTKGFDNPSIDLIACLRPTQSPGLWVQILGRGLRKADQKSDCLVLDYTDNSVNFGPIDQIKPPTKKEGSGDGIAPSKECPSCYYIIPASTMVCPFCAYEFPEPEKAINHAATSAPLLSCDIEPTEHKVKKTWFSVHSKPGKDACVKVEYECGLGDYFYDWIFPKSKFKSQYIKSCKDFKIQPFDNAADWVAFANGTNIEGPHTIFTIPDGKYTKVVRKEFYKDAVPF